MRSLRKRHANVASEDESLEYARKLYANILDWYKDAHGRAQLILTVDGAFVTLLAGAVVGSRSDLHATVNAFGLETWIALTLMAVAFALSGGSALWALMPLRLRTKAVIQDFEKYEAEDKAKGLDPAPSVMWYSQFIVLQKREDFISNVARMGKAQEQVALASQIHVLSRGLRRKYRGVFLGYVSTGFALLMLLFAAADYAIRA
jgi:hypothetical protein